MLMWRSHLSATPSHVLSVIAVQHFLNFEAVWHAAIAIVHKVTIQLNEYYEHAFHFKHARI